MHFMQETIFGLLLLNGGDETMIIRKDILRKQVKEKDPRGRKEGHLYYEDEIPIILTCIDELPRTTKHILEAAQDKLKAAGIDEIKAWHTMKKYLDKLAADGYIQTHKIGRSTCYFKRR